MGKKQKLEYDLKDKKYQWDLKRSMFNKGETPEAILKEWYKLADLVNRTGKDIYRSAKKFQTWIELYIKQDRLAIRFTAFINQKRKEFPKATKWKSLDNKFEKLINKLENSKDVWGGTVILKYERRIREYLKLPELKQYKILVENTFLSKKGHTISDRDAWTKNELASDQTINIIYKGLAADCQIPGYRARTSEGKEITSKRISTLLVDCDSSVRESAWIGYYDEIRLRVHSFGNLYYLMNYWTDKEARMYHYNSYLEQELRRKYNISVKQYVDILSNARVYKDLHIRFKDHLYGIINSVFKIEKFEPWDLELDEALEEAKYTPEQAKELVLSAFKVFGDEYLRVVKKIFDSKMIQWSNNINRERGMTLTAHGALRKEPILIDFKGDTASVATLAHEICHSVATYYAKKSQKNYKTLPPLVTEIPSCTGELVVLMYMFGVCKDPRQHFSIVKYLLSHFFYAVSESGAYGLFKEGVNHKIKNEGNIGSYTMMDGFYLYCNAYSGLTKCEKQWSKSKYPQCMYSCRVIESYYDLFYDNTEIIYFIGEVFGMAIACSLLNGSKKVLKYYLNFIKAGGSKKPLDALKILKLDVFNVGTYKWIRSILLEYLRFFEDTYITYNKPGSIKFGKHNKFGKGVRKDNK